jgi:hypothetical protein
MAFHESHERFCHFCKARMSATAPKCLNCGRLVDESDDDDDTPDRPPTNWGLLIGIAFGLVAAALIAYFLRGRKDDLPPEDAQTQELRRIVAQQLGRESVNETSTITWAEFKPELRAGRPLDEIFQLIAQKDAAAPPARTTIAAGAFPTDTRPEPDGRSVAVLLKDATVYIDTDAAGNIVSWDPRRVGP